MDRRDELEQQIWEFVYDLLPDDEAEALRRRIAAEADVARLHDEVRGKAALLAQAAKLDVPPMPLLQPAATVRVSARRWTNGAVALAASLLLCYLGFGSLRTRSLERTLTGRSPDAALAEQPVRTLLFGPPQLQPALVNYFAVQTQTAAGVPRAAAVKYSVIGDDGSLLTSGQCQSDASGFAQFNFRTSTPSQELKPRRFDNVQLELEPQTALTNLTVRRTLSFAPPELTTYLTADKTVYRPGERVRCRSVTLDCAALEVVREVPVEFRILDAAGQELNGARQQVDTQHGVGWADFELPRFQPGGKHTLVASCPTGAFPEARREFQVRPYATPTLRQKLDFARDSYNLGDEVEADLDVKLADGGAARNVPLAVIAEAGGQTFFNLHTTTDDQGSHRIRFRLPEEMDPGEAVLSVTAGKEVRDRISEAIPIRQGTVSVEFFPESGELVHGVTNRVYFFAHDALDKPVHIQGHVIDGASREVLAVQTIRDGRGVFELKPVRGQSYRLELDPAPGAVDRPELPPVSDRQFLALNAAPGVFAAGEPLRVRLLTNAVRPVAVSAVCRGVVVGQELVSPEVFRSQSEAGGPEVVVPVADTAEGVIRLTVYDYGVQPPAPVAERLVFRRPVRKLSVQPLQDAGRHKPGDSVELGFSVKDERGQPLFAALGASVVDEAALSLARDRSASLTTHFWLIGQIDDVRGLEDANFCLGEGSQAEQALDLLLGTQGWRRFVSLPAEQLAQMPDATRMGGHYFSDQVPANAVAVAEPNAPAVLADNAAEAAQAVRNGLASLQAAYGQTVQRIGRVLIVGSLILAVMLVLLAVMRRLPATTVWLPALGTSAMCLVLGSVWLVTQSQPTQEFAKLPALGRVVAEGREMAAADEIADAPRPDSADTDSVPELAKADGAASDRSDPVGNRKSKDGSLAAEKPLAAGALPAEGAAGGEGMPADKFKRLEPAKEAEKREDFDSGSLRLEKRQQGEADRLLSRERKTTDPAGQVEELQQDMPAAAQSRVKQLDMAQTVPPDASRARGSAFGRTAGSAGSPGEPARRSKGAHPAAPRPAPTAPDSVPEPAVQTVAEPPVAAGAPAASAPVQLMPMAAPAPAPVADPAPATPAAGKPQPEGVLSDLLAETEAKQPAQVQLRFGKKAEAAAGAMPGMAPQLASDSAAPPAGPAAGMGGGGLGFGGGAAATAGRDSTAGQKLGALGAAETAPAKSLPGLGMAPQAPSASRGGMAGGEPLARNPAGPGAVQEQRMFRQYARRSLGEFDAYGLSPPVETVVWEPLLLTDARGRATIQFTLPNATSTYRVLVDGHANGRIGSYLGRIVVKPEAASPPK